MEIPACQSPLTWRAFVSENRSKKRHVCYLRIQQMLDKIARNEYHTCGLTSAVYLPVYLNIPFRVTF